MKSAATAMPSPADGADSPIGVRGPSKHQPRRKKESSFHGPLRVLLQRSRHGVKDAAGWAEAVG